MLIRSRTAILSQPATRSCTSPQEPMSIWMSSTHRRRASRSMSDRSRAYLAVKVVEGFPSVPGRLSTTSNLLYSEDEGISMFVASPKSHEMGPARQTPMYSGAVPGPAPPSISQTRVMSVLISLRGVGIVLFSPLLLRLLLCCYPAACRPAPELLGGVDLLDAPQVEPERRLECRYHLLGPAPHIPRRQEPPGVQLVV